jgi:DNA-binding LacI/PurR family transcriptional regulator
MNDLYFKMKALILNGTLKNGDKLPSIRKTAIEEGLASNTVLKVYRKLVEDGFLVATNRSGYCIIHSAKGVFEYPVLYVLNRANIINYSDILYREITNALKIELEKNNAILEVFLYDPKDENILLDQIKKKKYSGLIIDNNVGSVITAFQNSQLPVILIDDSLNRLKVDSIVQPGFMGANTGAKFLLEQNIKDVIWIGLKREGSHSEIRYAGAYSALTLKRRNFDQEVFLDFDDVMNYNKIKETIDRAKKPCGVCCYWRPFTLALISYCQKNNLIIGKDVHVVSWACQEVYRDGFKKHLANDLNMNFVTWSVKDLGSIVIKKLIDLQQNPNQPTTEQTLPVYLKTIDEMNKL